MRGQQRSRRLLCRPHMQEKPTVSTHQLLPDMFKATGQEREWGKVGHTIVDGQTHPDDVNVSLHNLLGILNIVTKVTKERTFKIKKKKIIIIIIWAWQTEWHCAGSQSIKETWDPSIILHLYNTIQKIFTFGSWPIIKFQLSPLRKNVRAPSIQTNSSLWYHF